MKKLYRSETDKIFFGIIGGMGEYIQVDATVLRLVYTLFTLLTGLIPGFLFYMIALFIIPLKATNTVPQKNVPQPEHKAKNAEEEHTHEKDIDTKNKIA